MFQNALHNSNIWVLDSDMRGSRVHICGLQFHAVHLHGSRSIPERYRRKLPFLPKGDGYVTGRKPISR